MAVTVADLMVEASCFNCVSPGMWTVIELALLARIVDGNTVPADVATLLAEGSCMACQAPGQQLLILALLKLIQEAGGGGGSRCVACVSEPPTDPPNTDQCDCSVRIGIGDWTGYYWVWDVGFTNAWVQTPVSA